MSNAYPSTYFKRAHIPVTIRTAIKEDLNWINSEGKFKMKIGMPYWIKREDDTFKLDWIRFIPNKEERKEFKQRIIKQVAEKRLYILDLDLERNLQTKKALN